MTKHDEIHEAVVDGFCEACDGYKQEYAEVKKEFDMEAVDD